MPTHVRFAPLCALILLTACPVFGQSTVPPSQTIVVPAETQGAAPVDQPAYTQRAKSDMQDWEVKLDAFYKRAKTAGERDGTATDDKLKEAWAKTKEANRGLEAAGSDTWEGARHAYEVASGDLASAWQSAQNRL